MIRRVLLLVLGLALTAPLFATLAGEPGDPPVLKKKQRKDPAPGAEQKKEKDKDSQDELDLEKELRKLEGVKEKGKESDDQARKKAEEELKEIVARLHKNMQASEDRLGQKDPGDGTREIQKDILKDLDELIKQQNLAQQDQDSQCQDGTCDKDGQSQNQKKDRKKANRKSGKNQDMAKNKQKGQKGNQKPAGQKGGQGGSQQAKGDGNNTSDTTKQSSGKGNNRVSDIYKDIWGNYPERQRQEMDTYARERFMPRYEELLRQYYRTISEQGRKTKGD